MRARWAGLIGIALVIALGDWAMADRRPPRTELTILTGPEGGTYHAMAKDLERLMEEVVGELGIDLDVVPSQGVLQNIVEGFTYKTVPLAMVQADVLVYLRHYSKAEDRARHVVDAIQLALPLHHEEVHVVARRTVSRLADLAGKRVAIGEAGSGTSVTARVVLRLARVEPKTMLTLELPRAVEALRRGEIDALVFVSGAPSQALYERLTAADRFVFLPVRLGDAAGTDEVAKVYRATTIPAGTYPGQAAAVETLAVRTGIGTVGSVDCDALGALARAAVTHLPWLRENGHPKWKSVDLDPATVLATARLSSCVARALRR